MLILTRRPGEGIKIGNDVTVTVLGIKGNQVRVGIQAPREMSVDREEVRQRMEREMRELEAQTTPVPLPKTLALPSGSRRRSNTVDGNR